MLSIFELDVFGALVLDFETAETEIADITDVAPVLVLLIWTHDVGIADGGLMGYLFTVQQSAVFKLA